MAAPGVVQCFIMFWVDEVAGTVRYDDIHITNFPRVFFHLAAVGRWCLPKNRNTLNPLLQLVQQ
jgi:hypothetical protein